MCWDINLSPSVRHLTIKYQIQTHGVYFSWFSSRSCMFTIGKHVSGLHDNLGTHNYNTARTPDNAATQSHSMVFLEVLFWILYFSLYITGEDNYLHRIWSEGCMSFQTLFMMVSYISISAKTQQPCLNEDPTTVFVQFKSS